MNRRTLGAACVSCLMAMSGIVALGGAGYMSLTGKTLCSVMACGDKSADTTKTVTTVAAKEAGEKKSCCPLSGAAVKTVAAKEEGSCAKTCSGEAAAVKTVAAKAEGSCAKTCSGEPAVKTVAAKAEGSCAKTCSGEAVKTVAAKAEGSCAKTCSGESMVKASAKMDYVVLGGSSAFVMPAMFYKADAKVCHATLTEASGSCGGKSSCSSEKTAVTNASAKDEGCCKGSGVRADGQPCKSDGEQCKGEKAAEKPAVEAGKPVASR